jgi:hypothetical protein
MQAPMRTTLNLDETLLADFKQIAARSHRSLSNVIQDALREALAARAGRGARAPVACPSSTAVAAYCPASTSTATPPCSTSCMRPTARTTGTGARRLKRRDHS